MRSFTALLLVIYLQLSDKVACAQPPPKAETNRLLQQLREQRADTARVHTLLALGEKYVVRTLNQTRSLDSAQLLAQQAQQLSQQLRFRRGQEQAQVLTGWVLLRRQQHQQVRTLLPRLSPRPRAQLLLKLAQDQLYPPFSRAANADSARYFARRALALSQAAGDSATLQLSQLQIGASYLEQGRLAEGRPYFEQVMAARRRAGDFAGETRICYLLPGFSSCKDSACEAEMLRYYNRALALTRQRRDIKLQMLVLTDLGTYQAYSGLPQAKRTLEQALQLQKTFGYPAYYRAFSAVNREATALGNALCTTGRKYLTNVHYSLSEVSFYEGDTQGALSHTMQAIKEIEASGNTELLAYYLDRMSYLYYYLGQPEKSVYYSNQAMVSSRQHGELLPDFELAKTRTRALIQLGRARQALPLLRQIVDNQLPIPPTRRSDIAQSLALTYAALNQSELAEQYYRQSIVWAKAINSGYEHIACMAFSRFLVGTNQFAKAEPFLQRLLDAPVQQIPVNIRMDVHYLRFRIDSAQANYPAAFFHYQRHKELSDSVFNEKQSQQIAKLSVEYETAKKEQQLRLKENNIALLREQNKAQQSQRNALVGGSVLLLSLLGLGYNRYRLKQRSNQRLEAQQQKLQAQHEELQAQQEEIHHKNTTLQGLLAEKEELITEKERLLKEIHHRVKNNLQVVMGLLQSQADSLHDQAALSAIAESQHRIQSMALIHQKLYQGENLARISMPDYIEQVVDYLQECYQLPQSVEFALAVDAIELDVAQAVPLGLIINEAITNALKYAFPNGRPGRVSLSLLRLEAFTYQLVIADDGVGLPPNYDPSRSRSLGMTLLHGFSEQLDGQLSITSPPGLQISLVFADLQLTPTFVTAAHA